MRFILALTALVGLSLLASDVKAMGRGGRPKISSKEAKEAKFKAIDADSDGFISLEEFRKSLKGTGTPGTKIEQEFKKLDKDKDGKLTKAEYFGEEEPKDKDKKDEPKKKK